MVSWNIYIYMYPSQEKAVRPSEVFSAFLFVWMFDIDCKALIDGCVFPFSVLSG